MTVPVPEQAAPQAVVGGRQPVDAADPFPVDVDQPAFVKAQVQTNSHCNASCVMCPYPQTRKTTPQGVMPWALFVRVIDDLLQYPSLTDLQLTLQNEPIINKRLEQEIRHVRGRSSKVRISITTNGSKLDPERLDRLVDAGLTHLTFSLSGLTRETFERIEKGLKYDRVMANLDNLIERAPAGLKVYVKSMLLKENLLEFGFKEKLTDLFRRLDERGIRYEIGPISNRAGSVRGYDEMLVLEAYQTSHHKLYCHDPFEGVYVLFDGTLLTCCPDWERKGVLGNLATQTLAEVWRSPLAAQRRRDMVAGRYRDLALCRDCSQARNILENRRRCGL